MISPEKLAEPRPEQLKSATFVSPSTIELLFYDGLRSSLATGLLGMPGEQLDWSTLEASPDGDQVVVQEKKGGPFPIDSRTLRCLVDESYAAKMDATLKTLQFTENEAEAEYIAKRFAELTAKWKKETRYSSLEGKISGHPAYREIVAMGERGVPFILRDLESNGGQWFMALEEITGKNPVLPEDNGKINKMRDAWIAWGKAQGYKW